jgi:hypothetical protein
MNEFEAWPKIPRLRREISITEKIDGTNAQVCIIPGDVLAAEGGDNGQTVAYLSDKDLYILAGSRSRWITPGKDTDNFGFAAWVLENAEGLSELGAGRHYGEWWGQGIQRCYDKNSKTFSLFNTARPADTLPECVSQVPLLYRGVDDGSAVQNALDYLVVNGSKAAPWYYNPEGIVVYHSAARSRFKVLLEGDDIPKGNADETTS